MGTEQEAGLTAKLTVALFMNNTQVASIEDPVLFNRILGHLTGAKATVPNVNKVDSESEVEPGRENRISAALTRFASETGISEDMIVSACEPSGTSPYLHISDVHLAAFVKNQPKRGPTSLSQPSIVATLLAYWGRLMNVAVYTKEVTQVLGDIGIDEKNMGRVMKRCGWLMARDGVLRVRPDSVHMVIEISRAFCSKTPVKWRQQVLQVARPTDDPTN